MPQGGQAGMNLMADGAVGAGAVVVGMTDHEQGGQREHGN